MDGAAEAESKGGKIGPAAAGEPVDTEGREAEGKPALLDGKPLVATGDWECTSNEILLIDVKYL